MATMISAEARKESRERMTAVTFTSATTATG